MRAFTIVALLVAATAAKEKTEKTPPYGAWESVKDGAEDGHYERIITPHFSGDSDDIFMRSMIKKYAVEERTDTTTHKDGTETGGEPTGRFWMNQATALAASKEVLNTHKGLAGEALSAYLDTYFAKAWAHFDVNQSGEVEVIKMPQFMRFLASDQNLSLGESG